MRGPLGALKLPGAEGPGGPPGLGPRRCLRGSARESGGHRDLSALTLRGPAPDPSLSPAGRAVLGGNL